MLSCYSVVVVVDAQNSNSTEGFGKLHFVAPNKTDQQIISPDCAYTVVVGGDIYDRMEGLFGLTCIY